MRIQISLGHELDGVHRVLGNIAEYVHRTEPKMVPKYSNRLVVGYNCHACTAENLLKRISEHHDRDVILLFGTLGTPTHSVLVNQYNNVISDRYPGNLGHFDRDTMRYVFDDSERETQPIIYSIRVFEFLQDYFKE